MAGRFYIEARQEQVNLDAIRAQVAKLAGESPKTGFVIGNWNIGESHVVSIGAGNIRYKVHSLLLSIHNLNGTVITVRMYMKVNGTERRIYEQLFDSTINPPGLWIIHGTLGIHEVLRVTLQSNHTADNNKIIDYDYILETMYREEVKVL